MTNTLPTTRVTRFSSIIAPQIWQNQHVLVIGIGAIGRALSLLLSQLPLGSLTLVDNDTVSGENLGPQGFFESDIGSLKVSVTASECQHRNQNLPLHQINQRITTLADLPPSVPTPTMVFLCVDSMGARDSITSHLPPSIPLIDCRMGAQTLNIAYRDPLNPDPYTATLFPDSEALQEPCTGRSTPWCSSSAASLALTIWSLLLRDQPVPPHITFNLFSLEIFESAVPTT